MDSQFLEFWGNYLLMAAKGQRHLEDVTKWMHQGFKGFEDLTAMIEKFYGVGPKENKSTENLDGWNKATTDFQKSLADWMRLMGCIPVDEHQGLCDRVDALEKKVKAKEETIQYLRNSLDKEGNPQSDAVLGFAELVQKQTREFHELVKEMTEALDTDEGPTDDKTEEVKNA